MCIWIYLIKPRTECFEELVQWIVEEIRVEIPLFHVTVYYVRKTTLFNLFSIYRKSCRLQTFARDFHA